MQFQENLNDQTYGIKCRNAFSFENMPIISTGLNLSCFKIFQFTYIGLTTNRPDVFDKQSYFYTSHNNIRYGK